MFAILILEKLNARDITLVKLFQIPIYVYIFLIGLGMFFSPMGGFIITIICWALDCWSIIVSGVFMCLTLVAENRKNKINKKELIIHGILSFIFCVDVIDGIILRKKLK